MKYLAMEQPSRVEASRPAALSLPTDAGRQRRRRSWTAEQKLAILGEVQESGDPVAVVARRHDMNAKPLAHLDEASPGTEIGGPIRDPANRLH
ncbi:transposase [Mesorhizobium sp. 128a]